MTKVGIFFISFFSFYLIVHLLPSFLFLFFQRMKSVRVLCSKWLASFWKLNADVERKLAVRKSGLPLFVLGWCIGVAIVVVFVTHITSTCGPHDSPPPSPLSMTMSKTAITVDDTVCASDEVCAAVEDVKPGHPQVNTEPNTRPHAILPPPPSPSSSPPLAIKVKGMEITCSLQFRDVFVSDIKRVTDLGGNVNMYRILSSTQNKDRLEPVYEIMGCLSDSTLHPENLRMTSSSSSSLIEMFTHKTYVKFVMTVPGGKNNVMWFVCMRQVHSSGSGRDGDGGGPAAGKWVCMINPEVSSLTFMERITVFNPYGYFSCYEFYNPFTLVKNRACFDSKIAAEATMSAVKPI